ncbi:unnamed protein product [Prunus armeniaca]|uniref:Endonuclease/exonuclease/phosphatase domain-containing protein n=1 Tax=Prunus armeniaca TaxID=36596 RepID=A0A6J5WYY4_PRUAR|nr:unnamed protein product [Prunus armeniaca]
METKSKDNKIESLKRSCGFQKGTLVGSVGGLSLWWDDNIDLEVKGFSKKFIDTSITDNQRGMHYRASWVYGMPYREEKEACWNFLEGVLKYTDLPWLCGGDFNEILWSFEKRGGFEQPSNRPCYLHNFMEKAGLIDLGYQDRASLRGLTGRMESWPNNSISHHPAIGSDHNSLVLEKTMYHRNHRRQFKFEAYWADEVEAKQIIEKGWEKQVQGPWIHKWKAKLQHCTTLLQK